MSRRLKNKYLSRRKFARDGFGEKEEDDSGFFFFFLSIASSLFY